MPKSKPDQVIVHRIELQQSERELLEQFVAASSVNRVANGLGSLISSVSRSSVAGSALLIGIAGAIAIELESLSPGAMFPGTIGQLGANEEAQPFYPKQPGESASDFRRRTTLADRLRHGFQIDWDRVRSDLGLD
jgi:hypothetical protein